MWAARRRTGPTTKASPRRPAAPPRPPTARSADPGFAGLQEPRRRSRGRGLRRGDRRAHARGAGGGRLRPRSPPRRSSACTATTRAACTEVAVASTTGHAVSQTMTDASVLALAASDEASGYAEATSWRAADIDPARGRAARRPRRPAARGEPGRSSRPTYRAVLEPYAVSELLFYFGFTSLGALALLEDRSYLSGPHRRAGLPRDLHALGRRPRPARATRSRSTSRASRSSACCSSRRASPATSSGTAAPRSGRETAGRRPGTLSPPPRRPSARSRSTSRWPAATRTRSRSSPSGSATASTSPASTTSGSSTRRKGIITGMTRDGTFRIEGGKVTTPLVNLRFTTSFPSSRPGSSA